MVKVLTVLLQITVLTAMTSWADSRLPSPQRNSPVAVGEIAPDFTLADQSGNKVTLSEVRSKSLVVLVFYRGYW